MSSSSPKTPVRVGILGAANIARKNIRAIARAEGVEVVAIGSREAEKAEAMIAEMSEYLSGSVKAVEGYANVLAMPNIDAVYIPLPTSLHVEYVKKAAAAGKHILLEKPIAMSLEGMSEIMSACINHKVQLMDGTMMTHNPRARVIEKTLKDTASFGSVLSVHANFTFKANQAFLDRDVRVRKDLDGLGAAGDLGWYCVRAALWAFKWELPETVVAHQGSVLNNDKVVLSGGATLVWPGTPRRKAVVEFGFDRPLTQTLHIIGTKGSIHMNDFVLPAKEDGAEFEATKSHALSQHDLLDITQRETHKVPMSKAQEVYMWERFADCVRTARLAGGKPDYNWPRIALLTQRVVLAIQESILSECAQVKVDTRGGEQQPQEGGQPAPAVGLFTVTE